MELKRQGRTLREIRVLIDAKYARSGPSTPTPLPPR
jgi:hypothetical protein